MGNQTRAWLAAVLTVTACGGKAAQSGRPGGNATANPGGGAVTGAGNAPGASAVGTPSQPTPGSEPGTSSGGAASSAHPADAGGFPVHGGNSFDAGGDLEPFDAGGPIDGGSGGAAQSSDCYPAPHPAPLGAWTARPPSQPSASEALAEASANLAGDWQGVATADFVVPYEVRITFTAAGGYSAHCVVESSCCQAFYYGTDLDSDLKRWTLASVGAAGLTSGDLDIIYDYGASGFAESGYQGKIVNLEYDATGNRVRFQFAYGEIQVGSYDLQRLP